MTCLLAIKQTEGNGTYRFLASVFRSDSAEQEQEGEKCEEGALKKKGVLQFPLLKSQLLCEWTVALRKLFSRSVFYTKTPSE